jgi:hypothetical protein
MALAFTFGSIVTAQDVDFYKDGEELGPAPSKLIVDQRVPAVCECDLTGDGIVDIYDLMQALDAWGSIGDVPEDVNGDGVVDAGDLVAIFENFGACIAYEARPRLVEGARGTEMSGNMACLLASDNHRFRVCTVPDDEAVTATWIVCHGPAKTASRIDLTVETGVNRTGVQTAVCLWNFVTERYDSIDEFTQPLTDTERHYPYVMSPSNYLSDTGLLVLRLRTSAAAGAPTHVMRIDHVEVMVTP